MMTIDAGMNIAEVEQLAAILNEKSKQLQAVLGRIDRVVAIAGWVGPTSIRFKGQWWPTNRRSIAAAATGLSDFAKLALENARQQREASDAQAGGPRRRGGSVVPFERRENHEPKGSQPRVESMENILERGSRLQPGTFEILRVSDNPPRYIVNLRGIEFSLGDPKTQPHLQDMDAATAARLTGNDAYAERVKLEMQRAGIPAGAEVMLVGHSYGAIAAMNIASDTSFNRTSGDGYHVNVTHVVAAGAGVRDWVDDPPAHTDVLLALNRNDAVAANIQVADFGIQGVKEAFRNPITAFINDVFDITDTRSEEYGDGRRVMEFSTNDGALGHDYSNYIKGFESADSDVQFWLEDVDKLYFTGGGTMQATTVSVPDSIRY